MASKNIAAVLPQKFGPITVTERPIPVPAAGQILLRNKAIAGNPVDWMVRDYGFAVGPDVTKLKPADRVVAYAGVLYTSNADHGAWQTYTLVKENSVTLLPGSMSFEDAATFPMVFSTAINMFFVQLGLPRPTSVHSTVSIPGGKGLLIWGGGGAVASALIQLGRALGFTIYTIVRPKHTARLQKLGATAVFDYKDSNVVQKVLDAANSAHIILEYAVDCTANKDTLTATSTILTGSGGPSSKLVSLLPYPEYFVSPAKQFTLQAFDTFTDHPDLVEWFFNDYFARALAEGVIVPGSEVKIVQGGVAGCAEVLDAIKDGVSGVKLVVQVP